MGRSDGRADVSSASRVHGAGQWSAPFTYMHLHATIADHLLSAPVALVAKRLSRPSDSECSRISPIASILITPTRALPPQKRARMIYCIQIRSDIKDTQTDEIGINGMYSYVNVRAKSINYPFTLWFRCRLLPKIRLDES